MVYVAQMLPVEPTSFIEQIGQMFQADILVLLLGSKDLPGDGVLTRICGQRKSMGE
jgi:hypothetical protein